jgi:anti-sigma regulatory factor (Ser/Thr protein kinase)
MGSSPVEVGFNMEVTLPPGAEAPGGARRALEGLKPVLGDHVYEETSLLVSELVTNSVRHAMLPPDEVIRLRVSTDDDCVHVDVVDPGPGFDPKAMSSPGSQESGWGLRLLNRLATRWGVRRNDDTTVWFELATDAPRR